VRKSMNSIFGQASSRMAFRAAGAAVHLLVLLFFTGIPAKAQYRFDVWTTEKGLPQDTIRGIHQTPDGYLWIATLDGLSRFDGERFTNYKKSNTPGIVSTRFDAMVGGNDGDLWMVTESGLITRYHNGSFQTYGERQGLPENNPAFGITSDNSGHVWVALTDVVVQWDEEAGRFQETSLKIPRAKVLRWGHLGFWGWDDKGVHCFVQGQVMEAPLPSWLPGSSIVEAAVDQKKNIWLETVKGEHINIAAGKATMMPPEATIDYADREGHNWKMRIGQRLDRSIEGVAFETNSPGAFTQVVEDRENSLWLGTEGHGLYRLHRQFVQMYSKAQGLVDSMIYPIYQDHTGAVWIGAWNSGLSRFEDGKFTNYTVADGLPNPLVTALYEDRTGQIWIGTHEGLTTFVNGKLRKPQGPVLSDRAFVQTIYQDKSGTMWFGTPQGLAKYSDGVTQIFTTKDGLATNSVDVIIESKSGDLWVGGYGGLSKIHGGQVTNAERYGSPTDSIRSLYEDSEGVLWIGTYDNGLARLKNGQLTRYGLRDGLFSSGAFQIFEDAHNNLWMSSNHGIYRVSKKELDEFAENKRKSISSIGYGAIDGMLTAECNGGLWPAGIKMPDGKMWFPTENGIAIVDSENVPHNEKAPPVVIESSVLDRVQSETPKSIRVASGQENLEINYTALSFIKSSQIKFRYMMEGLDTDWIDAATRRTAYYSHMPPGNYVFHVIAENSDGVWNVAGQSLPVVVQAPFYKTWVFLAFLLLLGAGLIWAVGNYRIRQLQRAQRAQHAFSQQLIASQEGERKRIAAELHDSLGQRLIVIKNLALLFLKAHGTHAKDDDQVEKLGEISSEASLAIEETRSIAYNLRPFQLDRLGLSKSIDRLIRTVSNSSGIHFSTDLTNIDDVFPEELRINFYRIVQEALSNIMKHAEATKVNVQIRRTERHVIFIVRDNGRGFARANTQAGRGGLGLTGMSERASLLGGKLKIQSEPGSGTVMTVEIPTRGEGHA
jgi:signal transduction histidine kinase/ligand-binding sensor domain-containing protein